MPSAVAEGGSGGMDNAVDVWHGSIPPLGSIMPLTRRMRQAVAPTKEYRMAARDESRKEVRV